MTLQKKKKKKRTKNHSGRLWNQVRMFLTFWIFLPYSITQLSHKSKSRGKEVGGYPAYNILPFSGL